jgi:hypothetical protein
MTSNAPRSTMSSIACVVAMSVHYAATALVANAASARWSLAQSLNALLLISGALRQHVFDATVAKWEVR